MYILQLYRIINQLSRACMLFSGHPLCPVSSFRKYINKLNATCDDLWQRPNDVYTDDYDCWYTNQPNRQTSGESASLPQYLGCNTVFDMRLRVTFLCRKTVSLQSNIAHRE